MNNYYYLLNIKYRSFFLIFIVIIFTIILLIISIKKDCYDEVSLYGVVNDNNILVNVLTNNSDAVQKASFIKIDNKMYNFNIINISDIKVLDNVNYQIYTINVKEKYINNEVVKITFYSNKQKIIRKIVDFIF